MKAFRLSGEARAAVNSAVDAATKTRPMTRADEVKALMGKGMKISMTQGHYCWAFAPRKIAEITGMPFLAVMPALPDLADYTALGGDVVNTVVPQ
ncbi:MAG TPA: hypothetical protein VF534_27335 [Paraburkholderia sp.]